MLVFTQSWSSVVPFEKGDGGTGTMNIFLPGTKATTTFTRRELTRLPWTLGQISIPQSEHIGGADNQEVWF